MFIGRQAAAIESTNVAQMFATKEIENLRPKNHHRSMNLQIPSLRFAVVMLLVFSAVLAEPAFASPEEAAIVAGTKKYLAAQSYSSDMTIKVEKVSGDYARVAVEPKKKDMDGATVFLKRERGRWVGLSIGTGWDPADLDKLHIPRSLRP